ncbi:MAG: hypothetical protein H8E10_16250 [Desulfobacterales bacterium]|nr:hypothetical protein [Desulfobacterales bacterium]
MRYMDKEKAESARRAKEDLGKLKAYQGYEKERAAKQREMSKEFAGEMDEIKAVSAARAKEDLKKVKDLQAVTGNYRQKHLKIHAEWEGKLGNEL